MESPRGCLMGVVQKMNDMVLRRGSKLLLANCVRFEVNQLCCLQMWVRVKL